MTGIIVLSGIGILLAVAAAVCVPMHIERPEAAKLFGKVPWFIVAIVGYVLIAATSSMPRMTMLLATITVLVTAWLAIKAVRIRMDCPICPVMWLLNVGIAVAAFT